MEDAVDIIAVVAGLVQTGLYADFFYVYFTKWVVLLRSRIQVLTLLYRVLQGEKFELPA